MTKDEILLVVFLVAAFLIGAVTKHYRDLYRANHPAQVKQIAPVQQR